MKAYTQSTDLPPLSKITLVNAAPPMAAWRTGPLRRRVPHANIEIDLKHVAFYYALIKKHFFFYPAILRALQAPL